MMGHRLPYVDMDMGDRGDGVQLNGTENRHRRWLERRHRMRDRLREREQERNRERNRDMEWSLEIIKPPNEQSGRLAAAAKNAIPAVLRLVKELQVMETDPPENTWARPKSMSNLLRWRAKIRGPEGSPYEGGVFELALSFPEAYPFEAPIVRFITPLYHCNVNGLGYICVDILDEQQCWSPGLTVDKLLLSLSALLYDADPLTAYNAEAAGQFLQDRERYDRIARSWTERHAMDVPWD
ncbi:ubiquitin-conjugating enzyme E2 D4-like [Drosophila takahashii]|uniref:ubiquitin-conjugating enzyme E2 D4-like n=1 Tax=Drosophila takahashii TaxID=29030 RepID=UPI0007E86BA5|nr:ubiquitin-conjugating enzyme E2 D4-like [Drosophila takahashii]